MTRDPGPRDTWLNRLRHRRRVAQRGRLDAATKSFVGMQSFPEDWRRLMATPPGPPVPRILWMLWLQGEAKAPPLVRASFETWRRQNPGWRVETLDATTIGRHIDLPAFPSHATPMARADILRQRLLARHGGVWADATTLCLRPLDTWIDRAASGSFFAFATPMPSRALANWLLAAHPHDPLLDAWRRWSEIYILSRRPAATYHWPHFTFDWMIEASPEARRLWEGTPQVTARGPHVLQRILDGHLGPEEIPSREDMALLPLVKMNRRKVEGGRHTMAGIAQALAERDLLPDGLALSGAAAGA